jgi:UDP-2,3-diacylglucosamine pyrophosphatase LpxH
MPAPENTQECFPLPRPLPSFQPGVAEQAASAAAAWFDPLRWNAEFAARRDFDRSDPAAGAIGRKESEASAALFLSDFHSGDGTAGGDDFLALHIRRDDELGIHTGFSPPGASHAGIFASVLTFALERIGQKGTPDAHLDVVLNGDVINLLELHGRGGTLVAPGHRPLFAGLAALGTRAPVYWLRGNHDYVVPAGPWQTGEVYVNPRLKTFAEHGDYWDKENWPPGPTNTGSRVVIEGSAAFEAHGTVLDDGEVKYLMSGIDNLRPFTRESIEGFLDRRKKYSEIAWVASLLARLKFGGAADESAAYRGALQRRRKDYVDWLIVHGHTHVPALQPGVYANTGSWITSLVARKGKESHIEAFPFLLVYLDRAGNRVEEYFTVRPDESGFAGQATLETAASVGELRAVYGYGPLKT